MKRLFESSSLSRSAFNWDPFVEMQRMQREMLGIQRAFLEDGFFGPSSLKRLRPTNPGDENSSSSAILPSNKDPSSSMTSLFDGFTPFRGVKVDVSEKQDDLTVKAELPAGVGPGDINLRIENDHLILSGEKKSRNEEEEKNKSGQVIFHRSERRFGSFSRAIPLPCPVKADQIAAKAENGVLEVVISKAAPLTEQQHPITIEWK